MLTLVATPVRQHDAPLRQTDAVTVDVGVFAGSLTAALALGASSHGLFTAVATALATLAFGSVSAGLIWRPVAPVTRALAIALLVAAILGGATGVVVANLQTSSHHTAAAGALTDSRTRIDQSPASGRSGAPAFRRTRPALFKPCP